MQLDDLEINECVSAVYEYVIDNMSFDHVDERFDDDTGEPLSISKIEVPIDTHFALNKIFPQYETDEISEENREKFINVFGLRQDEYVERIERAYNNLTKLNVKLRDCFFFDDDFAVNLVNFVGDNKEDVEITDTEEFRGLVVEMTFCE